MTHKQKILASIASLAAVVGLGTYGTFAAFTDTTSNTGNTFASGSISISDDDGAQTMFTVSGLVPGATPVTKCINVTNDGTSPFASVTLDATVGGTGLAQYLDVDIDRGTGATGGTGFDCTGFSQVDANIVNSKLDVFDGAPVADANDANDWDVSDTKSYRVTVSLPSSADNNAASKNATLQLDWNATS